MEGNILSFEKKFNEVMEDKKLDGIMLQQCNDLYEWALGEGLSESAAKQFVKDRQPELKKYLNLYCWGSLRGYVQKIIRVDFLLKYTGWSTMDDTQKRDLLWSLGMNTKGFKTLETSILVSELGKRSFKEVVIGLERMDKEWTSMRYDDGSLVCSEEVRDMVNAKRYGGISVKELCNNKKPLRPCRG